MKILFAFLLAGLLTTAYAQAPQFAVVRPNGTSYILPTWEAAYAQAVDGDYIYLPGVTISSSSMQIDKKLYIYGAGCHPDSSNITGRTIITTNILVYGGGTGGSIEGVSCIGPFVLGGGQTKLSSYTVKRCRIDSDVSLGSNTIAVNVLVTESILSSIVGVGIETSQDMFTKNIIRGIVRGISNSEFRNNIFLYKNVYTHFGSISECSFYNNIFLDSDPFYSNGGCTNNFYNNLKVSNTYFQCSPDQSTQIGNISVLAESDIFINYKPDNSGIPFLDNYHLKPTCPGKNAGTDGTDVGIYGTSQPTSEGWVPSNPHIFYKQIAPQTGSDGKLNVRVKVRTND